MKARILGLAVVLLLAASAFPAETPLTNEDIVKGIRAGFDEETILKAIQANKTNFDTSFEALAKLKEAGASKRIIDAMLEKDANRNAITPAENADPNDPDAPHDPGIYIYTEKGSGKKLVMLEPTVYAQGKVGGFFKSAMTYGIAKTKWKAVVRGRQAKIRSSDPSAVFYFYVEEKGAFGGSTTPNEFALIRLDVKGDSREATVMQIGLFGGTSGTQDKANIPFTPVKIRPGVYKLTPNAPLKPGEYAFLSASANPAGALAPGAAGASRLFDFGVNPAK